MRSMIAAGMAAALLWAGPAMAAPDGVTAGAYRPDRFSVLTGDDARPLRDIGGDAIRFSSTPALGGLGFVIQLRGRGERPADAEVTLLRGHPSLGWRRQTVRRFTVPAADYAAFAAIVDAGLDAGDPLERNRAEIPGIIIACTDGPGYVVERRLNGSGRWLDGSCGDDHPNNGIIAALLPLLPADVRDPLVERGHGER